MMPRTLVAAVALLCFVTPSQAQSIRLEFENGLVTLTAQNAPLRAILAEWAQLGSSTVVNGDQVVGAPVTLALDSVPERQALDVLLRGVSGYMLAPRRAGTAGLSTFDRIIILPTSTTPRPSPPAQTFQTPRPFPVQPEASDQAGVGEVREPLNAEDLETVPEPIVPPPLDDPGASQPAGTAPAAGAPTPGNPFGVPFGTTDRPGVITPAPQQTSPNVRPAPEP